MPSISEGIIFKMLILKENQRNPIKFLIKFFRVDKRNARTPTKIYGTHNVFLPWQQ